MRRAIVIGLTILIGFTLATAAGGGVLGAIAPDFYRRVFRVGSDAPFDPLEVGLGTGAVLGFLAGVVVVVAGIVAYALPELSRQRLVGRRSFQPTFAGLMVAIGLVAFGFASLKNPSRAGGQLWFSLTALALASAAVLAISRPVERRGFAAGFAVIGGSYLLLSLFPESRAQLPTSDLLVALEKQVFGSWTMGVQILSLEMGPFPARQRGNYWEPVVTSKGGIPGVLEIDDLHPEFRRIGHSLFALLLGIAGGVMGDLFIISRGEERDAQSSLDEASEQHAQDHN